MKTFVVAACALCALAGASWAAPAATGRAQIVQTLSDCRKITADADRLACYDKAVSALDVAESQGEVVVVDEAQASAVRRQSFGLKLPSLNVFSRAAPKHGEGVDHLSVELSAAHRDANGKWVLTTTDGAVWRQTDEFDLGEDPHAGSKMVIQNGVAGSFFCKIDGQAQVRCARVG